MSLIFLLCILSFCAFHYVMAVFLKKRFSISYDKKTLLTTLFFLIVSLGIYQFANLEASPKNITQLSERIYWLILFSIGSHSVIQFMVWFIYSLLRHFKLTRLPRFTYNIFAWIAVIIIVALASRHFFNLNLAGFLVTSTVISAIVGLSVQDTLTNLFAGVSLQSEAPFTLGEWVSLGGQVGKVVDQNWRSLTLLSREHHRITLPNKVVAQEKIINYSRPTHRQIHIFNVLLDYSHPPNEVKQVLNNVLNDMKEVSIDFKASPFVKEFGDSGILYSVKFWIEDYGLVPQIQDKVLSRLWYALRRKNIKIPYPINELHVQMMDTEVATKKHVYNKEQILEELKEFEWLQSLHEDHLALLSEISWKESYAKDENLIIEGTEGDSMFIIVSGNVDVLVKDPKGVDLKVANKTKGEFFGEMSLLTGNPRTATIKAKEDTTVIVINKTAFSEILLKDSELLEFFFDCLESNQSGLTKILEEFAQKKDSKESGRVILMRRIKVYLNIAN